MLEAIALAAAADANKLDNEFLVPRGIRNTKPELMRSSFDNESFQKAIEISLIFKGLDIEEIYILTNDNQPYSKWYSLRDELSKLVENIVKIEDTINDIRRANDNAALDKFTKIKENIEQSMFELLNSDEEKFNNYIKNYKNILSNCRLKSFIIYSPENTALRNFYREGQIQPLGINGDGLLKLLKVIQGKSPEQFQEIDETLQLFDWYDNFELNENSEENKITIKDHYLTQSFDQRSANEGFLFVLFYIALMVSQVIRQKSLRLIILMFL